MIELGNTVNITNDIQKEIADFEYSFFNYYGVKAVLLSYEELHENEEYFTVRLNYPIPHVLSNVIPKDPKSIFAKLQQTCKLKLPNGGTLYLLNLMNPDEIKENELFIKNYEIINPQLCISEFVKNVQKKDVIIARLNIYECKTIKEIIQTNDRIDIFIFSENRCYDFLNENEQQLIKTYREWDPLRNLNIKPEIFSSDNTSTVSEDSTHPWGPSERMKNTLFKYPYQNISLKTEHRNFIEMVNKYGAIPESHSRRVMREIHFKRDSWGQILLDVTDMVLYNEFPRHEEWSKKSDAFLDYQKGLREKEMDMQTVENMTTGLIYTNTNPYARSEACKDCHVISYEIWKSSAHAKADETLKSQRKYSDKTCKSCHLTEWTKQPNWKKWEFGEFDKELGCESCHGACGAHIEAIKFLMLDDCRKYWLDAKERFPTILTTVDTSKELCLKCHNNERSPNFDYETYMKKIEHHEPDVTELPVLDNQES